MTQDQLRREIRDIENNAPSHSEMLNDLIEFINKHVAEVIGEDEKGGLRLDTYKEGYKSGRSELKIEQRKRAGL